VYWVHVPPGRAEKKFSGRNLQGKVVRAPPSRAKSQKFEEILLGVGWQWLI